jgi:hypothetical protein
VIAARACLAALALIVVERAAPAFVLSEDPLEEKSLELGLTVRLFSFVFAGPILRPPYNLADANPSGLGLFDLRPGLVWKTPRLKVVVQNQLTGLARSGSSTGILGLGRGVEPLRWLPLQVDLADKEGFRLRENLDWVYLALTLGPVTLTLGRQPITIGRGQIWKPLDLVSAFALTEVDTEYKPGTDALRLDWTIRPRTNLSVFAVAGKWKDELALAGSSFAARVTHTFGRGELGAFAGFIRRDVVLAVDGVVDAGKLDLYAEAAVHLLTAGSLTPPAEPDRGPAAARALLGATIKPSSKLTLTPEVFYNGFGAWRARGYLDVALSDRAAIGEMVSLGQLYAAALAQWKAHPLLDLTGGVILNPVDPSALFTVGLSYSLADNMILAAGAYLPAGRLPSAEGGAVPRSEFGLYPYFAYLELKAAM